MSDEESFVILGTSPTPSMMTLNSLPLAEPSMFSITTNNNAPLHVESKNNKQVLANSQMISSSTSNASQYSVLQNGDGAVSAISNGNAENRSESLANIKKEIINDIETCATSKSMKQSGTSCVGSGEPSLAASFILGEINSDVLKGSVYSQFPSMASQSCPEEVVKLQNLLSEYMEMKQTLIKTNATMQRLYNQTQERKRDVKAMEEEQKREIAKLRNENLELRRDLECKIEQIHINESINCKDHEALVQCVSEKTSQIQNLSAQIQKLEQQQLASFEFIPKNESDANQPKDCPEYVSIQEHQRIVKNIERQMSEIVAQNLEIKDMQSQYVDEINCLKVNLVAAEELQKKYQQDIDFLKAHNFDRSEMLTKFEKEKAALQLDVDLLRHQVEIFSTDFKMEQEARENLANEKGQVLEDLRKLQRQNNDLMQEAEKNYKEYVKQMTATGAFPKIRTSQPVSAGSSSSRSSTPSGIYTNDFPCPLCGKIFKNVNDAQIHANQCLSEN